jgi:hypothetical protein
MLSRFGMDTFGLENTRYVLRQYLAYTFWYVPNVGKREPIIFVEHSPGVVVF